MSGVLPTEVGPSSVSISSVQPTRVSTSHSLKRTTRTAGSQRWSIKFGWAFMTRAQFAVFYGFLLSQRGQSGTFTTVLPNHTVPLGTWSGTPVVSGAGQLGRSVVMSGFTASQAGVAKSGDLLKFAGHTKVYMVTADASSSAGGVATVVIEPTLAYSPAAGESVVTSSVPFTVSLASDSLDSSIETVNYALNIDLVEAW